MVEQFWSNISGGTVLWKSSGGTVMMEQYWWNSNGGTVLSEQ